MIELVSLSHLFPRRGSEPLSVLDNISLRLPGGHLLAVLGANESGKSVLLRVLAGVLKPQAGAILWNGRDVTQNRWHPNEVGYVSNDASSLQPLMSVKEHVVCAMLLQLGSASKRDIVIKADQLLVFCGLDTVSGVRVESLDPSQKRRLLLAIALVAEPLLVLCDDFTDGLDPKSERELAALLQLVARAHPHRVVLNATQSLAELGAYDTVAVLHQGRVCFHGPGRALTHYFSIPHTEDLYQRLAKRPSQRWQDSWNRHRDSYYAAFKLMSGTTSTEAELAAASDDDDGKTTPDRLRLGGSAEPETMDEAGKPAVPEPAPLAGLGTQVSVLLKRRWTVFRRSKRDWRTHIALLVGLPLLAAAFGAAQRGSLAMLRQPDAVLTPEVVTRVGVFAAGFIALQVLMVIAMAVMNGAREVASERRVWVRERFCGLRPAAYVVSKLLLVLALVLMQSLWLGLFVDAVIGGLPGNGAMRVLLLLFTSLAFTLLSLGTSALSSTADLAAARTWALAFLQIPLSGALLALPAGVNTIVQPFITAYYGWSGSVDTLKGTALFPVLEAVNGTWFATPNLALGMLVVHMIVGVMMLLIGLRRSA